MTDYQSGYAAGISDGVDRFEPILSRISEIAADFGDRLDNIDGMPPLDQLDIIEGVGNELAKSIEKGTSKLFCSIYRPGNN